MIDPFARVPLEGAKERKNQTTAQFSFVVHNLIRGARELLAQLIRELKALLHSVATISASRNGDHGVGGRWPPAFQNLLLLGFNPDEVEKKHCMAISEHTFEEKSDRITNRHHRESNRRGCNLEILSQSP